MSTKEKLLALVKATSGIYSGEKLAQELQVSRTAVWKAIRELEKAGYRFEHTANGYRYLPSDVLEASEVLSGLPENLAVEITESSESTMKDAKLAFAAGASAPRLFITETQQGGHGRFGRPFFSPKGQGIYMTLLLAPNQSFDELPQYTLLAAVAVCRAIEELTDEDCQIKWVNDIYLHGKKLVGILSEATSDFESGTIASVSIGMGINFSIPQSDFPKELQAKATSLFAYETSTITRNQLIQKVWQHFFALVENLPNMDYLEEYRKRSFVLGKKVSFTLQKQHYQGVATAITDEGQLVVQTDTGLITLNSGEISLESIQ
ncbi:biotin--[acetyl-CoA-carboxylase] ligase [Enterococcus asini]|uniref:biotin--[acetyl-CoA-carboxylase] ligase n=1 Tax=Enterococcus asini TaxID=57732 RepID=UPI00288E6FC1|nr:biotin--[acetyl-CoA-carboxylase] ligase [Enterococcus asini]MDT2757503.1 biotin--[acetyl-CoA-carboxylase] ligase [Enterococcus asini]